MSSLSFKERRIAKLALSKGIYQHRIAAHFGCNQGRISEFKNSPEFKIVPAADALPPELQ